MAKLSIKKIKFKYLNFFCFCLSDGTKMENNKYENYVFVAIGVNTWLTFRFASVKCRFYG